MQQVTAIKAESCKEMGGATSVMPLIKDAFNQWVDTVDWTVRCDWLQVASVTVATCKVACKF